ncbi:unnamed protein product [Leptosia nina]|uniref:Peroxidase n=1 Tax=Leptosia nina TaxID=320188 RepID=A0AAV1J4R9_9NEOP
MVKALILLAAYAVVGGNCYSNYLNGKELPAIEFGDFQDKLPNARSNGNRAGGCIYAQRMRPTKYEIVSQSCVVPPESCEKSRYRTYDGSCNNLENPGWGIPQQPYKRLLPFNYADGISKFPVSVTGEELPNVREISQTAFPDKVVQDPKWNLNAQQWGQFVSHDMSLTASTDSNAVCCDANGQLGPDAFTDPVCAPIIIPSNDTTHGPQGTQCLNFVRTVTTRDRNCTSSDAPAQPISVVSAYMDLSMVYGNSESQANELRSFQGGRLLTVVRDGREWPPQNPNVADNCGRVELSDEPCYLTGDSRMNQNPQLAILHIVLLREHNRIADSLAALNPSWDDEKIFQEARRIHIAENQHINYYEYLPVFLGNDYLVKHKLIYPEAEGYVDDYDPKVDPAVSDEHATAAYRHFHTLIQGYLHLITEDRQLEAYTRLSDWFNRPIIVEVRDFFDKLTLGLISQPQSLRDQFWDSEVTQYLFRRNRTFGSDLRSLDIQRGRDHGLGNYIDTRSVCGLPVPTSFQDMTDYISQPNVDILATIYKDIRDVELFVAASLEESAPNTEVGPTFLCLLAEQFYRTRVSDRYFYENGADPEIAFTLDQLRSIRSGSSMARLLCDNADKIQFMQPRAFELVSEGNVPVPCDSLPKIDLSLWQE